MNVELIDTINRGIEHFIITKNMIKKKDFLWGKQKNDHNREIGSLFHRPDGHELENEVSEISRRGLGNSVSVFKEGRRGPQGRKKK